MKLSIADNIKRLRKERNITQEELAGFWNISYQTISKWERGERYPDITLLPMIANFFEISVDELIGMEEIRKEDKLSEIHERWKEDNSAGKNKKNVAFMRKSLVVYPENYQLMLQLVTSLEKCDGSPEEIKKNKEEAIRISERILKYCPDYEIRNAVLFNVCFSYWNNKDANMAIERAKQLPNLYKTQENALIMFQSGEERIKIGQKAVVALVSSIYHQVSCMCNEDYYSLEEKMNLLEKFLKISEIAFEKNDVVEVLRCKENAYVKMADIFLAKKDYNQATTYLQKAADAVLLSEQAEKNAVSESMLANNITMESVINANYQKLQFSQKLADEKYKVLLSDMKFREICRKFDVGGDMNELF